MEQIPAVLLWKQTEGKLLTAMARAGGGTIAAEYTAIIQVIFVLILLRQTAVAGI